jgi:CheY-like chemotaxis protein
MSSSLQPPSPRFDTFEPDDKTALVCMDVPEMERLVVEQLSGLGYKVHTGISVEDHVFKMRTHPYDVLVIAENFAASNVSTNPLLAETVAAPAGQRQQQLVVLVGASMRTADESQSFQCSADVVVGLADINNLRPVIRRAALRTQEFYSRYLEAIATADVA